MQPFSQTFFPLGYPLAIVTASQAVLAVAHEEWDCWQQEFEGPAVTLQVDVDGLAEVEVAPAQFVGGPDGFRFFAGEGNVAVGDFAERTVTIQLSHATVADPAYLRYYFLEAAAYQMITALHCAPIHAACVSLPGRGSVLLCGDSGAGKSSLAYACARRGWIYTSDDASHLVRSFLGRPRVVGNAHRLRLRPEAALLFEELAAEEATVRGNGDRRYQLWTSELAIQTSAVVNVDRIVRLMRDSESRSRFSDWRRAEAEEWFDRVFFHWAPAIAEEQRGALRLLLDQTQLETFHYSRLDDAVAALEA